MSEPQQGGAWPQLRGGMMTLAIIVGGMSVLSMMSGRRGDVEAGLLGAAIGGTIAGVGVGIDLIGRWLIAKRPGGQEKGAADPAGQADRPAPKD